MKTGLAIIAALAFLAATLVLCGIAMANNPLKVGFRAYSTTTRVECGVFGSNGSLPRDDNGQVIQYLPPNGDKSRTFLLGTKGMANYSTNGVRMVTWTCRVFGSNTAAPVKVFLNGVETHFLTLSTGTFAVAQ